MFVRFVLFLSSFSSLFAMLALRFTAPGLRLGALGLCLAGLVGAEMVQINPVFYLLGRRVQKITTAADDWQAYLITSRRVLLNETIQATTLSQGVLVRSEEGRR